MLNKYILVFLITASLIGCNSSSSSDDTGVLYSEVFVGSTENVPELCSLITDPVFEDFGIRVFCPKLMTSDDPKYNNQYTYSFVNFEKQFGTVYTLKVEVNHLKEPPEDASSVEKYVLEVLDEQQDPLGTVYFYKDIPLYTHAFLKGESAENLYMIGYWSFLCAENVDCDTLVELSENNSGGLVSVEITLTGGDIPGTITAWY